MREAIVIQQAHQHVNRTFSPRDEARFAQLIEQAGQADRDADTRQLRLAVMTSQVVVTATGTDRADLRVRVQRGLVNHAGVVIQTARNRQVQRIARFRHAQRAQLLQDAAQFIATFHEQRGTGTQRVEFGQRIVMTIRAHPRKCHQLVDCIGLQFETLARERGAYSLFTALVQLVQFAQHRELLVTLDAHAFEIAAQQLAMVELDGEIADRQPFKHRRDDRRDLRIEARRQAVLADHIDVALVELAETAALGALATVDALHLVAPEREREVVLVLGHVSRQRHGQVEAQGQLRHAVRRTLLKRAGGLHEIHLALGFAAGLGQQHVRQLHHRRFHRQKAEALESLANRVQHPLEGDLVTGQELHDTGRRAWLDQESDSGAGSRQV